MKRIRWIIIVIVVLLILGIIPSWQHLLKPFSEECGLVSGNTVLNSEGKMVVGPKLVENCNCEGFSFGETKIGSYNTYCLGTCSECKCTSYNSTLNAMQEVDCDNPFN